MDFTKKLRKLKTNFFIECCIAENRSENNTLLIGHIETMFLCWRTNFKLLSELALVLKLKVETHLNFHADGLYDIYKEHFDEVNKFALENLKNEELDYYHKMVD